MESTIDLPFVLKELEKERGFATLSSLTIDSHQGEENRYAYQNGKVIIVYREKHDFFHLLALALASKGAGVSTGIFSDFGVMLDCSRNAVLTVESVKKFIRLLALLGYNTLQLYTEDTYEIPSQPYWGYLRGRYSQAEIREIDSYAALFGVELIPCIQTLAHLGNIFRYSDYQRIHDNADILMVGDNKTYDLIDKMFDSIAHCFSSRRVNIGMDEAFSLGTGAYLKKNGYRPSFDLMIEHLLKVNAIAKKHGFTCYLWSDMFFRLGYGDYFDHSKTPESDFGKMIPADDHLIYWDYYHLDSAFYGQMIEKQKSFCPNPVFAGGAWTWNGFCPANAFAIAATAAGFGACRKHGVKEAFITLWGDNGGECSFFTALPALARASQDAEALSEEIYQKEFILLTGLKEEAFLLFDEPNRLDPRKKLATDNPSKYLLYNDILTGLFDPTLPEDGEKFYRDAAQKISVYASDSSYGYLFDSIAKLCLAIAAKYSLGRRLRSAYHDGDEASLRSIRSDLEAAIQTLLSFYRSFRFAFLHDHKPFGFDVQDLRLGGLYFRMKDAEDKIDAYLKKEIPTIPELEETLLPPFGSDQPQEEGTYCFNDFLKTITVNFY